MGVPKRRTSKSRIRSRKSSSNHKRSIPGVVECSKCGEWHIPHRICAHCGTYNERQILTIEKD